MPIKPSPSVLRAADILEYLSRQPLSLSEIARRYAAGGGVRGMSFSRGRRGRLG